MALVSTVRNDHRHPSAELCKTGQNTRLFHSGDEAPSPA